MCETLLEALPGAKRAVGPGEPDTGLSNPLLRMPFYNVRELFTLLASTEPHTCPMGKGLGSC